jgi:hypothetical protein
MFGGQRQHTRGDEQTFRDFEGQPQGHLPEPNQDENSDLEDKNTIKNEPFSEVEFCQRNAEVD